MNEKCFPIEVNHSYGLVIHRWAKVKSLCLKDNGFNIYRFVRCSFFIGRHYLFLLRYLSNFIS